MSASSFHSVAERYSRALFGLALDQNALEPVEKDLKALRAAIASSPALPKLFSNPLLPRARKAEAMVAVLKHLRAHAVTQDFVSRIALANRLPALTAMIERFEAMVVAHRGEVELEIITAQPMSDATQRAVAQALEKAYGKRVHITPRVDASLIGGIAIKAGGRMMDYSVKSKLNRLQRELKAA